MKRGFTLIELLVYMAIMGFIIVVAGRVFSDSTVMRVRSQNMIKTAEEVGKIANLISEDVSQMGAKAWGYKDASGNYIFDNASGVSDASEKAKQANYVYMSASSNDSSSFRIFRGEKFDTLVFRKAEFGTNGDFDGVREITWGVSEKGELFRACRTIAGKESDVCLEKDTPDTVTIADNIRRFSIYLSAPGTPSATGSPANNIQSDTVFPFPSPNTNPYSFTLVRNNNSENRTNIRQARVTPGANNTVAVNNFSANPASESQPVNRFSEVYLAPTSGTQVSDCIDVPIRAGETYVVEFNMPFPAATKNDSSSNQFLPGMDHIAVGLRDSDGNSIDPGISPDILLYAPQSKEAESKPRYAEFTANDKLDRSKTNKVCVALTFAFYSPEAYRGTLYFKDFKIFKKHTGAYHFVRNDGVYYENEFARNYAAEAKEGSPVDYKERLTHKKNVKAIELLLEIDRNGEVAGTYSKGSAEGSTGISIPVPNNGATSL
jgi:prepilin-type N-terminal cleavage/methylation domain-containing protein